MHLEVFRLLTTFAAVSLKNAKHSAHLTSEIEKRIALHDELEVINQRLDHLAQHDDLTGVYNRRTFEMLFKKYFHEAKLKEQHLSVMILDIDHFKQYNDQYGHLEGDRCISAVANALEKVLLRKEDIVARYGGDEFMILLPDTAHKGASFVAHKLITAIQQLKIPHETSYVSDFVTISLGGISKKIGQTDQGEDLLIAADKALYKVKQEIGRGRYSLF